MPKMSVGLAMTVLIIGNLIAVFSDALIKTSFMQGLKWHVLRGHVWLFGAIFMVIALNSMPLATANAIFYAAPLIMLPLAMLLFQEKLTIHSVGAGLLGFIGVIIVIQPSQIDWAAIFVLIKSW